MTIPTQASIEIPLLLELERHGGQVRKSVEFPAFYNQIEKHFPNLTSDDKELRLPSGPFAWHHNVEWSRFRLRRKGEINGGYRGIWTITDKGRERLRRELQELGITHVEDFIKSKHGIPEEVGDRWLQKLGTLRGPRPEGKESLGPPDPPGPAPPKPNEEGQQNIKDQLITRLQALEPAQFEHLIAKFLEAKGFSEVRVTGRSGDRGIDGECTIPFLKLTCAFQAKRYREDTPVGSPDIRGFKGGVVGRYERGIFVTTSSFTPGAKEEAEQPGVTLILIDGKEFVGQLLNLRLGIKTTPVVERTLDEEFFNQPAH